MPRVGHPTGTRHSTTVPLGVAGPMSNEPPCGGSPVRPCCRGRGPAGGPRRRPDAVVGDPQQDPGGLDGHRDVDPAGPGMAGDVAECLPQRREEVRGQPVGGGAVDRTVEQHCRLEAERRPGLTDQFQDLAADARPAARCERIQAEWPGGSATVRSRSSTAPSTRPAAVAGSVRIKPAAPAATSRWRRGAGSRCRAVARDRSRSSSSARSWMREWRPRRSRWRPLPRRPSRRPVPRPRP